MLSLYRLPNKLPNEKAIKVVRKDFFILLKRIMLLLILALLPLAVFYFFLLNFSGLMAWPGTYPVLVLSFSAYALFLWLFFFFSFIDYYLDIWIITDERIIDIQQNGFFSRTISEQKLFRIQDVTSEVQGFFPTMFHFGDVHVQTAGVKQRFHFNDIPHPEQIRELIIKLAERKRKQAVRDEVEA